MWVRNSSNIKTAWCSSILHRPCVGITAAPPEEMQWFCSKCANKKKDKKHKKRKHRAHWRLGRGLKSCGRFSASALTPSQRDAVCSRLTLRHRVLWVWLWSELGARIDCPFGGCCVSQAVRAQGGGFGYILMLSFTYGGPFFAQSCVRTSVVNGAAPVARQQQRWML